jgi:hypothetical protein
MKFRSMRLALLSFGTAPAPFDALEPVINFAESLAESLMVVILTFRGVVCGYCRVSNLQKVNNGL